MNIVSLKVSAMIVYDVATKVLDTESLPQHKLAGLISGITFIVLCSQEKPLQWKETHNIHTHAHTQLFMKLWKTSSKIVLFHF